MTLEATMQSTPSLSDTLGQALTPILVMTKATTFDEPRSIGTKLGPLDQSKRRLSERTWLRENYQRFNSIDNICGHSSKLAHDVVQEQSEDSSSDDLVSSTSESEEVDIMGSTTDQLRRLSKGSSLLLNISREDIRLVYTFTKSLGSGSYGTVRIAHKTVSPG